MINRISSKLKAPVLQKIFKKMEGHGIDWEKILADHLSDKRFVYGQNKEVLKITIKILKIGKIFNRNFTKENFVISYKLMKRYSGSLVIMETQIKTKARYDHKSIRMAKIFEVSTYQVLMKIWKN